LLRFLRNNDADGARALMLGHMIEAEQYMLERAETVRPRTVSGQSSII
jgi:DNA-binding GntR family transcriptional regulator